MAAVDSGLLVSLGVLLKDLIHLWSDCFMPGGRLGVALRLKKFALKLNLPLLILIRAFLLDWDFFEICLVCASRSRRCQHFFELGLVSFEVFHEPESRCLMTAFKFILLRHTFLHTDSNSVA